MYVSLDQYQMYEREYKKIGLSDIKDIYTPVDMNLAYIPTELSQKDKESDYNLQKSSECNQKRFCLQS